MRFNLDYWHILLFLINLLFRLETKGGGGKRKEFMPLTQTMNAGKYLSEGVLKIMGLFKYIDYGDKIV